MKFFVKALFLMIMTATLSCKKGKSDISGTYQLIENTAVSFANGTQTLTVTASNLIDSRCPVNVTCVWEGYAAADLLIKTNETENKIKLCTGGCNLVKLPTQETITLNGVDYQIQLKNVVIATTSNQKTAVVTLVKI
ncbi:hypothetical protein [Pedobacter sp. SL55]|uniref:hypothetical protein n=1 Tax=Pedobacter sp. SL55 TaxID=2995161 RepID=UPI00226FF3BD|nr:hypothetical protein [Pedobacter sp. SL55]WAC39817.1 hypothetical protein OVA16_14695 [Pedobacter sp. SL55]